MWQIYHNIFFSKNTKKRRATIPTALSPPQKLQKLDRIKTNYNPITNSTSLHESSGKSPHMPNNPFAQLICLPLLSFFNSFLIISSVYPKAPANRLNSARCRGLSASYIAFIGFFSLTNLFTFFLLITPCLFVLYSTRIRLSEAWTSATSFVLSLHLCNTLLPHTGLAPQLCR